MQGSTQHEDRIESGVLRELEAAGAFQRGRRAGLSLLPPPLAEGQPGSFQHQQWMAGWRAGNAQRAEEADRRMRSLAAPCRYAGHDCHCGGRGLCLDVA